MKRENKTMAENKKPENVNNNRRRAVLGAVGGASALAVWHKPVITSVVLPAHAQMSPTTMALTFFASGATVTPVIVKSSPLDLLIPEAVASEFPIVSEYSVTVEQTAPETDNYNINVFERRMQGEDNRGEFLYSGSASQTTGGTLAVSENPCELRASPIDVSITTISETAVTLEFTGRNERLEVPAGSGSLPMPVCSIIRTFSAINVDPSPEFGMRDSSTPSILNTLIPEANAQEIPQGSVSAVATGDGMGNFNVMFQNQDARWNGTLTLNGDPMQLTWDSMNSCTEEMSVSASLRSGFMAENGPATVSLSIPDLQVAITLVESFSAVLPTLLCPEQ